MDLELKVLLIEDEPAECQAIANYIAETDNIRLCGVTNSSDRALEYVADCLPDAVILDIELLKGTGSGLFFLEKLKEMNPRVTPYKLITTSNQSKLTFKRARELGADYVISKEQEDYSAKFVIDFLMSMKSTIQLNARKTGDCAENLAKETEEQLRSRIKKRINSELELIGISPKMLGKNYLVEGIYLIIKKPNSSIAAEVSKIFNKTESSVFRSMQHALAVTWQRAHIDTLQKYYTAPISSEKGCPTMTEFVYYYADRIRLEI